MSVLLTPARTDWVDIEHPGTPDTTHWRGAALGKPYVYDNTAVDGYYYLYFTSLKWSAALYTWYECVGVARSTALSGSYEYQNSDAPILEPTLVATDWNGLNVSCGCVVDNPNYNAASLLEFRGNFTVECLIYVDSDITDANPYIFRMCNAAGTPVAWMRFYQTAANVRGIIVGVRINGVDYETTTGPQYFIPKTGELVYCSMGYNAVLENLQGYVMKASNGLKAANSRSLLTETEILSLAVLNNRLYGGTAIHGKLFKWNDVDAWTEVAPKIGSETYILSLAVMNGEIYGGTSPNGNLLKWNGTNAWTQVAPKLGAEINIYSLAIFNSKLYGGTDPNGKLYEWNGTNAWVEVAPNLYGSAAIIFCLAVYNGKLYGGTNFGTLIEWNGANAWVEVAPLLGSGAVYSLTVFNDKLYGGKSYQGKLLEWNGTNAWTAVSQTLELNTVIYSLAVFNGKLYGGSGGPDTNYSGGQLYEWNGTDTWVLVAPRLGITRNIRSLVVYNNKLYGGTTPYGKLLEWDGVDVWIQAAGHLVDASLGGSFYFMGGTAWKNTWYLQSIRVKNCFIPYATLDLSTYVTQILTAGKLRETENTVFLHNASATSLDVWNKVENEAEEETSALASGVAYVTGKGYQMTGATGKVSLYSPFTQKYMMLLTAAITRGKTLLFREFAASCLGYAFSDDLVTGWTFFPAHILDFTANYFLSGWGGMEAPRLLLKSGTTYYLIYANEYTPGHWRIECLETDKFYILPTDVTVILTINEDFPQYGYKRWNLVNGIHYLVEDETPFDSIRNALPLTGSPYDITLEWGTTGISLDYYGAETPLVDGVEGDPINPLPPDDFVPFNASITGIAGSKLRDISTVEPTRDPGIYDVVSPTPGIHVFRGLAPGVHIIGIRSTNSLGHTDSTVEVTIPHTRAGANWNNDVAYETDVTVVISEQYTEIVHCLSIAGGEL